MGGATDCGGGGGGGTEGIGDGSVALGRKVFVFLNAEDKEKLCEEEHSFDSSKTDERDPSNDFWKSSCV
jgi:hypothetical protein